MVSARPALETLVAEPTASFGQRDGQIVATLDNGARPAYDLSVPQGHTLMVNLFGEVRWSDAAAGHVGFYLVVQRQTGEDWETVGSDGASGGRTGQDIVRARLRVPVVCRRPGRQQIRAILWSTAQPSGTSQAEPGPDAEARDQVDVTLVVLEGPDPASEVASVSAAPSGPGWLDWDPPDLDEILP